MTSRVEKWLGKLTNNVKRLALRLVSDKYMLYKYNLLSEALKIKPT